MQEKKSWETTVGRSNTGYYCNVAGVWSRRNDGKADCMPAEKMPDAFIETYHRIVTEFFPQSTQYEYAENVEFEVYSSEDVTNPDYQCEIWIAVKEREA